MFAPKPRSRRKLIRILVTGSSGLVGSEVLRALHRRGHDAVPFDIRRPSDRIEDICDAKVLGDALRACDGVIHLAAISRVAWGEDRPDLCDRVNIDGTAKLLSLSEALNPKPWFLFSSSREIYGDPVSLPVTEEAPTDPVNVYGRSKAAGERLVKGASSRGMRTAIVRLSNVYGTICDHHDRAIPALLWRAMTHQELKITGAANRFDFVHVDDSVSGLLAVMDRLAAGEDALPPIHLATGTGTSLGQLAELCVAVTGSRSQVQFMPPRPFDVAGFIGDPARAAERLGWTSTIGLEEGLRRFLGELRHRDSPLAEAHIPDPAAIALVRRA